MIHSASPFPFILCIFFTKNTYHPFGRLFCLRTLTLGQEYVDKPFSMVTEKVKEMREQHIILYICLSPLCICAANSSSRQEEYKQGKRNKWLHDFMMMISLLARGNYVTMTTYFPELQGGIMRQEVCGQGFLLNEGGDATYPAIR